MERREQAIDGKKGNVRVSNPVQLLSTLRPLEVTTAAEEVRGTPLLHEKRV
jgi:hypothetical protein